MFVYHPWQQRAVRRGPGRPGCGGPRQRTAGLTLIELMVVLIIVAVLVGILLPAIAGVRRSARVTNGAVHARAIHQGMMSFAQDNGGWYPGRNARGQVTSAMVEKRYVALLEGDYVQPDVLISPADPVRRSAWSGGDIHRSQYSYALPVITSVTGMRNERAAEFRDTVNPEAVAVSDRAIANGGDDDDGLHIRSIHTSPAPGTTQWQGTVVWNDGRVTHAPEPRVPTRYGHVSNPADHLFASPGDKVVSDSIPFDPEAQSDALMSSHGPLVGISEN